MTELDDSNRFDNSRRLDKNDLIEAATRLWGNPTRRGKTEWRFGAKGSKKIDLVKLTWYDFEEEKGEGIQDLCRRAGINGSYHGAPARAAAAPRKDDWQPSLTPPREAPINLLTCDRLHIYRSENGTVTHYVKRFEQPRRFLPLTYGVLNGATGWHIKAPRPPLPLYNLDQIHALDPELILLCEGEKAADAANQKIADEGLNWLAVSWSGGARRARDADVSVLTGRRVVIWPDADEAGWQARDTLLEMIEGATALDVEGLPNKFDAADLRSKEKIGEWVTARMKAEPAEAKPETTTKLPPDISIDDFYAYLPKHQYLYVPTQDLWPPATISSRLGKHLGTKAARWLDKNRAISQIIWTPGEPQIVNGKHLIQGGWINKPGAIVFNQYREPPLLNGDPALAAPWLNLLKFLYPKPMEHEHIIKVLAYKLQHPEAKINHALVLAGGMRIGKDSVILPIRRALGPWNVREAKPTEIMGSFNPFVRSIILVINETRDLGDVKRYQFYDHMKDIIASAGDVTPVNDKNEKVVQVLNVCLVIMTTNYRTDGLYLPQGDGRHFPVWSERTETDFEPDYFPRYHTWLKNSGTAHVAAYLRSLNVESFQPGSTPPRTDLFYEIVNQSRPVECSWIDDILDGWGMARPAVFILKSLTQRAVGELRMWLEKPENQRVIPYRLEECGYTKVRNPDSQKDGRWKIGGVNQNIYGAKDLSDEKRLSEARQLKLDEN